MRRRVPVCALVVPLLACGSSGTGPPEDLESITQSGTLPTNAEAASSVPVAFKVLHGPAGNITTPESNKQVTIKVLTGGGTVDGKDITTVNTGADGIARATWSLGPQAGHQTLRGSINGSQSVDLAITAIVTQLPKLTLIAAPSGSPQSGIPFFQQPVVQLSDPNGNSVNQAGVAVTVSVASGGGTLGVASPAAPVGGQANAAALTVNTDATGKATFNDLTLSGSGSITLQFAAAGYTPVTTGGLSLNGSPLVVALSNGNEVGTFGSTAGSQTYASFVVPAGTNDLSFSLYGGTGTVHLYARKGAYPTAAAFDCASKLAGTTQACINTAGLANPAGQWYLLANGITDYQGLFARATAYGPSCAPAQVLVIDTPLNGTLNNATDCQVPTGKGARDRLVLPLATQRTLRFDLTTTGALIVELKAHDAPSTRIGYPAGSSFSLPFLLPNLGVDVDYEVDVADNQPGLPGGQSYTLTATSVSADQPSCGPVILFDSGIVAALTLTATDCAGITAGTRSDRFYLWLLGGQTVTATMSSSGFDPYLRVLPGQALGAATPLVSDDNGGGGTTARVTYTNPGPPTDFTLEATSALAGATGAYTLSFTISPTILTTPAALVAALRTLQPRRPPR